MVGEQEMSEDQRSLWKCKGHVYTELQIVDGDSELNQVSHQNAAANHKVPPKAIRPLPVTKSHHLWGNCLSQADSSGREFFLPEQLNKLSFAKSLVVAHDKNDISLLRSELWVSTELHLSCLRGRVLLWIFSFFLSPGMEDEDNIPTYLSLFPICLFLSFSVLANQNFLAEFVFLGNSSKIEW